MLLVRSCATLRKLLYFIAVHHIFVSGLKDYIMTYVVFFGSLFVAFGPALALFLLVITRNNQLIILTIGGAFFWLVSVLFASIWWFIIPPLRHSYWWIIPWSVVIQEGGRYLFYRLYIWAFYRQEATRREQVQNNARLQSLSARPNNVAASLAVGVGAGVTYALVMYTSILWESTGPGSLFSPACPSTSLFMVSAMLALCFVLLHIFQSMIAFEAYRLRSYRDVAVVWSSHLLASLLSLANLKGGSCAGSVVPIFIVSVLTGVYSIFTILRSNSLAKKE